MDATPTIITAELHDKKETNYSSPSASAILVGCDYTQMTMIACYSWLQTIPIHEIDHVMMKSLIV